MGQQCQSTVLAGILSMYVSNFHDQPMVSKGIANQVRDRIFELIAAVAATASSDR